MKKILISFFVIIVLMYTGLFGWIPKLFANVDNNQYLYIELAERADFIYEGDHYYRLILSNVDPFVTYFSNAPQKISGFTPTHKFVKGFKKSSQGKEGLNAGIIAFELNKQKLVRYIVTLSDPHYDEKNKSMSYKVHLLTVSQGSQPASNFHEFKHVALFIDGCASCGGGGF